MLTDSLELSQQSEQKKLAALFHLKAICFHSVDDIFQPTLVSSVE